MDFLDKGTCFPQPYFEEEVIYLLNDINIMFQKLFHEFYSPYGLTMVQIPVLMTLKRNENDGVELDVNWKSVQAILLRFVNVWKGCRSCHAHPIAGRSARVHVEITRMP